jgi:hypothetical protein
MYYHLPIYSFQVACYIASFESSSLNQMDEMKAFKDERKNKFIPALTLCQQSFPKGLASKVETVQDFLIKLGIKPRISMHVLEMCIFSLNHVIVRPTKIMNNLLKD